MIKVIVNQRPFGFADGLLNPMKLLRNIMTGFVILDHLNDAFKIPAGSPEPLDDFRMALVDMIVHA